MTTFQIVVLAIIQGLAELLPVSSSAHVIVAAKLMRLDPADPQMTLLLVMLHTGTMLAVIAYFWQAWRRTFFASKAACKRVAALLIFSTILTALVGYPIKYAIEKIALRNIAHAEIEMIFGNLGLVAGALAAAGALILYAGLRRTGPAEGQDELGWPAAGWMGAIQGLCLPFRGFSRSGATISAGMILGTTKARVEEYSFAMAVIITPPVVFHEIKRFLATRPGFIADAGSVWHLFAPSLLGLVVSFLSGLLALAWLSRWLEHGRWYVFGIYCLLAAGVVFWLHLRGF